MGLLGTYKIIVHYSLDSTPTQSYQWIVLILKDKNN